VPQHPALGKLRGCYTALPTLFHDDAQFSLNLPAMREHVEFLISGGLRSGTGILLAGGAAGDFSTMTCEERIEVGRTVVEAAAGRAPVALGAQTTSTGELVLLARAAQEIGADFIQVSPPYYFSHTEDDLFEHVAAASDAAGDVGIIVYNTYWTSAAVSLPALERLVTLPNVVGLKWSTPDSGFMEFESILTRFADRLAIIDNQLRFATSHMLGARAIELHVCNHWPQFGVRLWEMLEAGRYVEAQQELVRVAMPYAELWAQMESYTGGDGYLDKMCMEAVGLASSRCRPPTRDVRPVFREQVRAMLAACQTPGLTSAARADSDASALSSAAR
jgi:dihydrodipicolinate synthase/N-acetylneuraminate lyase